MVKIRTTEGHPQLRAVEDALHCALYQEKKCRDPPNRFQYAHIKTRN